MANLSDLPSREREYIYKNSPAPFIFKMLSQYYYVIMEHDELDLCTIEMLIFILSFLPSFRFLQNSPL